MILSSMFFASMEDSFIFSFMSYSSSLRRSRSFPIDAILSYSSFMACLNFSNSSFAEFSSASSAASVDVFSCIFASLAFLSSSACLCLELNSSISLSALSYDSSKPRTRSSADFLTPNSTSSSAFALMTFIFIDSRASFLSASAASFSAISAAACSSDFFAETISLSFAVITPFISSFFFSRFSSLKSASLFSSSFFLDESSRASFSDSFWRILSLSFTTSTYWL